MSFLPVIKTRFKTHSPDTEQQGPVFPLKILRLLLGCILVTLALAHEAFYTFSFEHC